MPLPLVVSAIPAALLWKGVNFTVKQSLIKRLLLGFPLGIALSFLITLLISLSVGDGSYYPCVPELAQQMGTELNAVVLQTVLSGIMGSAFAAASLIWQAERLSLAAQTALYLAVISIATFPIAYFAYWMPHTAGGILLYIGLFLLIFLGVWLLQYYIWRVRLRRMNRQIQSPEGPNT